MPMGCQMIASTAIATSVEFVVVPALAVEVWKLPLTQVSPRAKPMSLLVALITSLRQVACCFCCVIVFSFYQSRMRVFSNISK